MQEKLLTESNTHLLEKGIANHFSILALRTPWTVEKGKKITYKMGENICKNNWKVINLQNIQTAHVAQYKKQTTQSKMGRRSK